MKKMMKAAIYYGSGDIKIEEVPVPKAGPDGVVLKIKVCGVCPLIDLNLWITTTPENIGKSLGHEFSGEVVEVGSRVTDIKVGDRVYAESYTPCYRCASCIEGDYYRCINWYDGHVHAAFAEYYELPVIIKKNLIKLPETLSYRDLALIEPLHLSVGLARKAKAGDVVVVLGQHLVGLGIVPYLKKIGVAKVITGDISKKRLEASRELGADIVVDTIKEDIVQVVMKETRGEGVDVVIQSDTRPIAHQQAMSVVRRAGKIWLGTMYRPFSYGSSLQERITGPESPISWIGTDTGYVEDLVSYDPGLFFMKSAWGTLGARVELYKEALELIQSGKITAAKHVTHVFPLDKIKEAFEMAQNTHESIEVMIEL